MHRQLNDSIVRLTTFYLKKNVYFISISYIKNALKNTSILFISRVLSFYLKEIQVGRKTKYPLNRKDSFYVKIGEISKNNFFIQLIIETNTCYQIS